MRSFLTALMVLVLAVLAAGFLGRIHPAFDSIGHFRLHVLLVALGLAALAALAGARRIAAAGLVAALAAFISVAPYVLPLGNNPTAKASAGTGTPGVTLLQMNLLFNADLTAAMRTISDSNADIVTLQEVTPAHWETLAALNYPHRTRCETPRRVGDVAILSRLPFAAAPDVCIPQENFMARAVPFGDGTLNVVSQHLSWPWPHAQQRQVEIVAPTLNGLRAPTVIAGDFNAAPWSANLRAYARAAGTEPVGGIGTTWPTMLPGWLTRLAGLPIDNILVTPGLGVAAAILPPTASDHSPVLVNLTPTP
ncbi:endonuclease/exonuclease/phosphatase family protein [Acuticoccus sp. MNP-M23]|uniref:endonuclease/exonuclease/phosphatase family protein n=1 Tax=Acuticoccus sp. MNP-M23 TaxID=3072793 RepID=UPI002815AC49|nr:endonuclease/exonuclease/phosphatase family protein [Acuticoccus sp. MNP-M23]WMS44380.1 endonuclease/exonuclease/phosphatase family protein [Acuticoccus sp. MNP-M23]